MEKHHGKSEYSDEPADPMIAVPMGPSEDEYDLRQRDDDLDNEYGDIDDVTHPSMTSGFYKKSLRRQNCFFGISMLHIVAAFIGAYFLMGWSFTITNNGGVFGDEMNMEGSSGEVGIDASNAEVQEIIDEEIVALEEAGHWGDNAKKIEPKQRWADLITHHDKIGMNNWTENKQWWRENHDHLDESKMSKKEKKIANRFKKKEMKQKEKEERKKRIQERQKNKDKAMGNRGKSKSNGYNKGIEAKADATDLDILSDKIGKHFNLTDAHAGRPGNDIRHKKGERGKNNKRAHEGRGVDKDLNGD